MINYTEKFEVICRLAVVYLLMFLLFIINIVATSASYTSPIEVPFVIMVIFYWAIYRPTLIPPILVFCAGIVFDMLSGLPVGLSAFIFLVLRQIVFEQRLFLINQTFIVIWLVFMLVLFCATILQWILFGLINLEWTLIDPVFQLILSGIIIFPLISIMLSLIHKILPELKSQYAAI